MKLHHVDVKYEKGFTFAREPKIKDTEFDLTECKEEMFKTEFEKAYFKHDVKGNNNYCVDDPNGLVYLNGTKNESVLRNDYAYIYYSIERCSKKNQNLSLLDPKNCHDK